MNVKLVAVYAFALAGMAFGSNEVALVIERMQAQVMADKYCSGVHLNEQLCQRSRFIAQQN
ncbi:MAG: hypothetical protein CMK74_22060 [Pseudomonadales bacterium]|nr:hypothetical protein [Pseudomonadales bacterium]|tara:strand:+ start:3252 stop:3434 length:183 start_codon:yes stop_codon:yes gene_type:complete